NIQFLRNQFSVFEYEHPNSILIHDNSNELKWFPYSQYNFKDIAAVPYSKVWFNTPRLAAAEMSQRMEKLVLN
ncbi:MAG: hypothetical protein LBU83_13175, partial [Bacteroidales bacterium]|nr:hypothetical protein [Bacteroidales bacterium]